MATYEDLYQDACEEDAKERTRQKVAEELLTDEDFHKEITPYIIDSLFESERFLEQVKPYVIENDTFLSMVMGSKYKEVRIKKSNTKSMIIEGVIDYDANKTTFILLKNKYPNSDVRAVVHRGKIKKYQVVEKIKFAKEQKNNILDMPTSI